ncbi:SVM family protein, predicted signal peptide [Candidatus Phytoplasma rubi]|uniref:SVM family protein, predicted signal peptide n=1 Tax=Candidatus Phytoplasma rubi TaxID=399025 RepID=A0ABY7BT17_9MOLU|nr:SVM family protein [Candidatus Phytoplasma rubi]WAN63462.1 SVM family protein, predicted signal peptide [Candidatus Phytoplasma rubi]
MFKLQNQFKIISFCLFVLLGLLLITNNHKIMGMENNNRIDELNAMINNLTTERQELIRQIENLPINSRERENLRSAHLYLASKVLTYYEEQEVINITDSTILNDRISVYTAQINRLNLEDITERNRNIVPLDFASLDEIRYAKQCFENKLEICSQRLEQIRNR